MTGHTIESAHKRLRRAGRARKQPACTEILQAMHLVAPFDCAAVMTADPETLLPSGGVFEGLDSQVCQPFWNAEVGESDVLQFADLARAPVAVGALARELPRTFEDSARFRQVYSALPLRDELRVVFRSGGAALGMAVMLRVGRNKTFSQEELEAVQQLAVPAADLLRRDALLPAAGESSNELLPGPVIALVGDEGEILGKTPGVDAALADLRGGAIGSGELPPTIIAPLEKLKNRLQQATAAVETQPIDLESSACSTDMVPRADDLQAQHSSSSSLPSESAVTTRVRGASGTWYRLHVAPMSGQQGSHALSIEPARAGELLPIFLQGFGLTGREVDVVHGLVRGLPSKKIAEDLRISTHTANDHIKSIYLKAQVGSRSELLARLFASQELPPVI